MEKRSRVETLPKRRILDDVTPKWTSAVFKKYKKSGKNARSPSRKASKKLIEKRAKNMQKSCRKVLQHQVRSKTRFQTNFEPILGRFRHQNPPKIAKKPSQSACEKTADFWHAKKTPKWTSERSGRTSAGDFGDFRHARRHARRSRGVWGDAYIPAKVFMQ